MGFSFANIHIKKQDCLNLQQVQDAVCNYLTSNSYQLVSGEKEADFALFILNSDSHWFSVCCDAIEFSSAQAIKTICEPISSKLHTDVIASACFDSDFLFLNLINIEQNIDAWAKFGHDETKSFLRRNAYKPWTDKVSDIDSFKQILKKQYVFAEEAWSDMEPLLQMRQHQGLFNEDSLGKYVPEQISVLFFASTGEKIKREPPQLSIDTYDLMPCVIGKNKIISAINLGGASKGIGIAFSGSYVESGEITFRDVQIEYGFDRYPRKIIPLTLEKIKTDDDQWIYYAVAPNFAIPERVKDGLPMKREMDERFKRSFGVRFTPEGNTRKCLDICVHFIPLSNNDGQCCWYVWGKSGSKKNYIDEHNKGWMESAVTNMEEMLLNPDDFDDVT